MTEIIIATGNAGKVKEFREMFAGLDIAVSSLADHWNPVPDIAETGSTFYDNAKIKADWVYGNTSGVWALADDSGLEVDALGGAPGVISARYSGNGATASRNNEKLLHELRDVPEGRRTARFKCVLVLRTGADTYLTAEGTCEGRIIDKIAGDRGFGYDPLFIPDGFDKTFAQIDSEDKNRISHRGVALKKLYNLIVSA
ncbi:MAG: RdgB/HAM1 family non-canonical purine NTP pyrophosphatase [Chitinispirillia bacterium]|nr:RdgB/HAM1 family non-canonical purine NTP pyrophosphatase [Chitinispirillia bacterium]MCL2268301.1 RdgB/HAM1 family non-canonical purine NTP pyrophosphatase [Chitinispirillia bacterium]